jgi:hypothetical protein
MPAMSTNPNGKRLTMRITYPAAGIVSVWIGSFLAESDFDRCVDGPIVNTLELSTPLASVCETSFEDDNLPVRRLIEGFSGWESFVGDAERAATKKGIIKANAALVCYHVKCEDAPELWDKMHFLGSFPGSDVS